MTVPTDWWKEFFTGIALDLWRQCTPDEHTRAETDFIEKQLGLRPPARILDVPCGNGRHTRELARRGYQMTGVDYAAESIAEARAVEPGLAIAWEQRDMRDLPWQEAFDVVFSFGNSFGYLDDAGNRDFLRAVRRVLKPGGRLLLDAPMVAETLLLKLQERTWHEVGDILFLGHRRYDPERSRLDVEYIFIHDGKVDRRPATYRVYLYRELCGLLEEAGFGEITGQGGMEQEPFRLGSPTLYLTAVKRA